MTDARSEILGRVREALADRPQPDPIPRDYDSGRRAENTAALFADRVADYEATVWHVDPPLLTERIAERLAARGVRRAAIPADVPPGWRVSGVDWLADDPPLPVDALDSADGVLSGCAVAIAETGTIVLDGSALQGRRMLTLVPDYHLCIVRAEEIVTGVPAALARLEPTRPLTFISGPSATSDIELERVEGVHGPRTLDVLLVHT